MAISVGTVLTKVFGSRNERLLKRYRRIVEEINELEPQLAIKTDAELRARTQELRKSIVDGQVHIDDAVVEALAIIRESMDRHIGIREIFNPDQNFDPNKLNDENLELYDSVQRHMIATGESWTTVQIPVKLYEGVRKVYPESRPPFRARCFDVQLIGGLVLYEGKIAEMATGEGKTFVAPLACFLKVMTGAHCHVVTVNDYLVRRDSLWVKPAFTNLGINVGYIQADMEPGGDARRRMYQCDITYGTNSEFGFDYLRDNMKERLDLQVQGPLDYAIVDEVDSILIDEARTPLIISGAARDDAPKYRAADGVARKIIELHTPYAAAEDEVNNAKRAIKTAEGDVDKARTKEDKDAANKRLQEAEQRLAQAEEKKSSLTAYYEVELDRKSVHLTHEGIAAAQDAAGVGSFYMGQNMEWPHLMEQALRAHVVYERDKDYVVERGQRGEMEVVIVDEFTGRKMVGRQWSDGLHQAVEAKERVPIKQETQTLATITLQNFFKLYRQIAGMTGTAQTESEEFMKIYRLEVVTIPTNRPRIRLDSEDRIYRTEREKWEAIIEEIKRASDVGRPVLVGTTSVEKSEMLSMLLTRKYGIKHEVLNAKQHEREAHIVALAGQQHVNAHGETVGNVTIATNMAGRGTDIKPAQESFFEIADSNGKTTLVQRATGKKIEVGPEDPLNEAFQIKNGAPVVGGLHVIGTERHTARRIDNQLRGRSGRQGDAGSSRFYVSLQDELMRLFAGEWTINVLKKLGMGEGEAIESRMITKSIERAQRKVEERNFLARKNLLEYDDVMDRQRTHFYGMRQQVLEGRDVDRVIWDMIGESINDAVNKYITQDFVAATIAEWVRVNFSVAVEPQDLVGYRKFTELEQFIKDQARAEAQTSIPTTLMEFLGEDPDDPKSWDVLRLQAWAQERYGVSMTVGQLRNMSSHELEDRLIHAAVEQIEARDCAGVMSYLEEKYAQKELSQWVKDKFAVDISPDEFMEQGGREQRSKPSEEIVDLIQKRAHEAYGRREIEYPVDHVLMLAFGGEDGTTDNPYMADAMRNWVKAKFNVDLSLDHVRSLSVRQLRDELIGYQESLLRDDKLKSEVGQIVKSAGNDQEKLVAAFNARFPIGLAVKDLSPTRATGADTPRDLDESGSIDVEEVLYSRARGFLRHELTDLEQFVLIQIFDQTWKDHLYGMDMLKSGIGLQAFAERDPRVLYKKQGYQLFQEMMAGVRDKVTDLIFRARIQGQPQQQTRSAYRETAAVHADTGGYGVAENVAQIAPETAPEAAPPEAPPANDGSRPVVKPIIREVARVGRNDPCPCGSGKKYKKCHGSDEA